MTTLWRVLLILLLALHAGVVGASPTPSPPKPSPTTSPTASPKKKAAKDFTFSARLTASRKWEHVDTYRLLPSADEGTRQAALDELEGELASALAVDFDDLNVLMDDGGDNSGDELDDDDTDDEEDDLAALSLAGELPTIDPQSRRIARVQTDRVVSVYRARAKASLLLNRPSAMRWASRVRGMLTEVEHKGSLQRTIIDARTGLEGKGTPLEWSLPVGFIKRTQGSLALSRSLYVEPRLVYLFDESTSLRMTARVERETFDAMSRASQSHTVGSLTLRPRFEQGPHKADLRLIAVRSGADDPSNDFHSYVIAPRYRYTLGGGWSAVVSYRVTWKSFDDLTRREDRTTALGLVVKKHLGRDVKLSLGVSRVRNASSNPLYPFNRTDFILGIDARFK